MRQPFIDVGQAVQGHVEAQHVLVQAQAAAGVLGQVGGHVVALSALATTALLSVGTAWTEAAVVAAALVAKFQDPPPGTDPLAATHDTLASLAELGLMELQ